MSLLKLMVALFIKIVFHVTENDTGPFFTIDRCDVSNYGSSGQSAVSYNVPGKNLITE